MQWPKKDGTFVINIIIIINNNYDYCCSCCYYYYNASNVTIIDVIKHEPFDQPIYYL